MCVVSVAAVHKYGPNLAPVRMTAFVSVGLSVQLAVGKDMFVVFFTFSCFIGSGVCVYLFTEYSL